MARKTDIHLKKKPKQQRSKVTVDAILEAATYVLRREGPSKLTTNKVAERAGVNISSFYQYFPNKEALVFHMVALNWETEFKRLEPILLRPDGNHARNLRDFIREFFIIEAAEADLRQALRIASVELRHMEEFQAVIDRGADLTRTFLNRALSRQTEAEREFAVSFIVRIVTSFGERLTDDRVQGEALLRQADLLCEMLIKQFEIASDPITDAD